MPKHKGNKPGSAYLRLENSPYRDTYIEMRKRGYSIRKVYEKYLELESALDAEKGMKPLSYVTFNRWINLKVPAPEVGIASLTQANDLTVMAMQIIEKDREIIRQLDENLNLLKALVSTFSRFMEEEPNPKHAKTIVELIRESRQTIQAIIELRARLKSLGMVSPRLVRDALVEAVSLLPGEERVLVMKKFDEVIQRIIKSSIFKSKAIQEVEKDDQTSNSEAF